MRNYRKNVKIGVLVLIVALFAAQAIRIQKTNPPSHSEISANPAIKPLLKKACFNCHSNETVWPWYSSIAPVSWLIGSDVNEGRRELNFSEWESYSGDVQKQKLKAIAEELQDGDMPPWYYSMMHRDSQLSPEERNKIKDWAVTTQHQTPRNRQ
jgi:hypothetical protein